MKPRTTIAGRSGESMVHTETVPSESSRATTPVEPPPLDRYENEGEIGRGGMGRVYRVLDKALMRRCAMKVLAPDLAKDAMYQTRFVQEAQITGQLDHPNIVPVHSLGVAEDGKLYFTMKLLDGETLDERLYPHRDRVRKLDWIAEYLEVFTKVCDAVAFAHSRGVVHRDLKPGNVIVGTFGQVYLMDWGIARLLGEDGGVVVSHTREGDEFDTDGALIGTVEFMAPEQAWGAIDRVDARTDVFSLGASLYYILTGRSPYEGCADEHGLLAAVRNGHATPIDRHATAAQLPAGLKRIAMRAMARRPEDRYRTVTSLKNDVIHYLRGAPDLPTRRFDKGELVLREGDVGEAAFIIREGHCEAFKTIDGERVVLRTMGPNDVFGELGILSSKPRTASIVALEDLVVDVVDAETLRDGVGLHTWFAPFVAVLAERFREVDERLTKVEYEKRSKSIRP